MPPKQKAESSKGKKLGSYQIGDELGKGSYGRVYRGLNVITGEVVALKQVEKKVFSDEQVARIRAEHDLLQKLNHPNVVKFLETKETDQHIYFILEIVEGGSLQQAKEKFGVFPETLLNIYITQVLRGCEYLHSKGVIHRDIKGANILVNKEGQCKLADFGGFIGDNSVPFWSAPEVLNGQPAVPGSDIWSVACTIVELLTGNPPFHHLPREEARQALLSQPFPYPSNISADLEDFLKCCLKTEAKDRPRARQLWITNGSPKFGLHLCPQGLLGRKRRKSLKKTHQKKAERKRWEFSMHH